MKVLLLENISAVAVDVFRDAGYDVESLKPALEERELIDKMRDVSILGVRSKTHITAGVLAAGPKLAAVGAFCIGVDKVDTKTANERGIAVFNDPHSNSRSVAELAMGEDHPAAAPDFCCVHPDACGRVEQVGGGRA